MRNGLTQCDHTELNWANTRNALKNDLFEARRETTSKASALYLQVAAKIINLLTDENLSAISVQ